MPNIEHSAVTDPYIHEPKGASTATAGQVYIADGAGSGNWAVLTLADIDVAAPASAAATGTAGTIAYDSSYIYVCISANTWKRVAISTW